MNIYYKTKTVILSSKPILGLIFFGLVFLFILSSVFDILSVKLLENLLRFDKITEDPYLGNFSVFQEFTPFLILFLSVILMKFIIEMILNYSINKFSYSFQIALKRKLIPFFIEKADDSINTEKKINLLFIEIKNLTHHFIRPLMKLGYNIFMILALILYLITLISWSVFFGFFMAFSMGILLIYWIGRIGKRNGMLAGTLREHNMSFLADILNGSFEINMFDKTNRFRKQFFHNFYQQTSLELKRDFSATIFKPLIEIFLFSGIAYFIGKQMEHELNASVLIEFGIIVLIILKIIPLMQQFSSAYSNIRFYSKSLDVVYNLVICIKKDKPVKIKRQVQSPLYKLSQVSFSYHKKEVLSKINLDLKEGMVYYLKGPSGAGKSTLLNLLAERLEPSSGEVSISKSIEPGQILYLRQNPHIFELSLAENISMLNPDIPKEILQSSLKKSKLEGEVELDVRVGPKGHQISGGQRQKINISRLFTHVRPIILIDEAFNSIDKQNRDIIFQGLLQQKPKLLIYTSHDEDLAKFADQVIDIHEIQMQP